MAPTPKKPSRSWTPGHKGFPAATRRRILARDPTCQWPLGCEAPSTEADHITNVATARLLGWTEEEINHEDNGQGLCNPHHRIKTRREQAAGRARARTQRTETKKQRHPGLID